MESGTDFIPNMQKFIKNYGVSIQIPQFYPLDAAIYPKDPKMVLQLVAYVIPENQGSDSKQEVKFKSTDENGFLKDAVSFINKNEYKADINKCGCIQLIENEGRIPKVRKEIFIKNSRRNKISFSPDGNFLILYRESML